MTELFAKTKQKNMAVGNKDYFIRFLDFYMTLFNLSDININPVGW